MLVAIHTMIIIQDETKVVEIATIIIGKYPNNNFDGLYFMFIMVISEQKHNYSEHNSRDGEGGGKKIFFIACMSVFELQKLTIHAG